MATYAELDASGVWQNTISWDGVSAYTPPSGWTTRLVSTLPPGGAQGWTLTGSTWTPPAVVVPEVPATVAMWQAKAALQGAGLLTAANNAVSAANNQVLTAFWNSAASIDRASPTLASIAETLGLTSAQVDALFIAAGNIAI